MPGGIGRFARKKGPQPSSPSEPNKNADMPKQKMLSRPKLESVPNIDLRPSSSDVFNFASVGQLDVSMFEHESAEIRNDNLCEPTQSDINTPIECNNDSTAVATASHTLGTDQAEKEVFASIEGSSLCATIKVSKEKSKLGKESRIEMSSPNSKVNGQKSTEVEQSNAKASDDSKKGNQVQLQNSISEKVTKKGQDCHSLQKSNVLVETPQPNEENLNLEDAVMNQTGETREKIDTQAKNGHTQIKGLKENVKEDKLESISCSERLDESNEFLDGEESRLTFDASFGRVKEGGSVMDRTQSPLNEANVEGNAEYGFVKINVVSEHVFQTDGNENAPQHDGSHHTLQHHENGESSNNDMNVEDNFYLSNQSVGAFNAEGNGNPNAFIEKSSVVNDATKADPKEIFISNKKNPNSGVESNASSANSHECFTRDVSTRKGVSKGGDISNAAIGEAVLNSDNVNAHKVIESSLQPILHKNLPRLLLQSFKENKENKELLNSNDDISFNDITEQCVTRKRIKDQQQQNHQLQKATKKQKNIKPNVESNQDEGNDLVHVHFLHKNDQGTSQENRSSPASKENETFQRPKGISFFANKFRAKKNQSSLIPSGLSVKKPRTEGIVDTQSCHKENLNTSVWRKIHVLQSSKKERSTEKTSIQKEKGDVRVEVSIEKSEEKRVFFQLNEIEQSKRFCKKNQPINEGIISGEMETFCALGGLTPSQNQEQSDNNKTTTEIKMINLEKNNFQTYTTPPLKSRNRLDNFNNNVNNIIETRSVKNGEKSTEINEKEFEMQPVHAIEKNGISEGRNIEAKDVFENRKVGEPKRTDVRQYSSNVPEGYKSTTDTFHFSDDAFSPRSIIERSKQNKEMSHCFQVSKLDVMSASSVSFDTFLNAFATDSREAKDLLEKSNTKLLDLEVELVKCHSKSLNHMSELNLQMEELKDIEEMLLNFIHDKGCNNN